MFDVDSKELINLCLMELTACLLNGKLFHMQKKPALAKTMF